jgi:hypothetical protein
MVNILKGNLKDTSLSDILTGFQRGRGSGTLQIAIGSIFKKVFIKNGEIVFASSDEKEEQIGEVLLKKGEITLEEYNKSISLSAKTGQCMEKVLVKLGCLTPEELSHAIKDQVEEIILGLFAVEEGRFEFHDGPVPEEAETDFHFYPADIVYKGIMGINNFNHIKQLCPGIDDVLNLSPVPQDIFQDITIDDADKKILSYVNGLYSVKMILKFSPLNDFETLKRLCAFFGTGLIMIKRGDETATELPDGARIGPSEKITAQPLEAAPSASDEEFQIEQTEKIDEETRVREAGHPDQMSGMAVRTAEEESGPEEPVNFAGEKEGRKKKMVYIWVIAIVVTVLVIAFLLYRDFKKDSQQPVSAAAEKTKHLPPLREQLFKKLE